MSIIWTFSQYLQGFAFAVVSVKKKKKKRVLCLIFPLCAWAVVSNFLQPHGLRRLLCPWNFSKSKNTGVGYHSFITLYFSFRSQFIFYFHLKLLLLPTAHHHHRNIQTTLKKLFNLPFRPKLSLLQHSCPLKPFYIVHLKSSDTILKITIHNSYILKTLPSNMLNEKASQSLKKNYFRKMPVSYMKNNCKKIK